MPLLNFYNLLQDDISLEKTNKQKQKQKQIKTKTKQKKNNKQTDKQKHDVGNLRWTTKH